MKSTSAADDSGSKTTAEYDLVVVGGGLAGLAISMFFADQGMSVLVIEAHADPRSHQTTNSRSINITLCARGLHALDRLGLGARLGPALVPVTGRLIHLESGDIEHQRYDLAGNEAIYSIQRDALLRLLFSAAEEQGVTIRVCCRCTGFDAEKKCIYLAEPDGRSITLRYQRLICADGARSSMRSELIRRYDSHADVAVLSLAYKELSVSAAMAKTLHRHSLHVWPRRDRFLIVLPNADGSFTASIFVPIGRGGFEDITTRHQARQLFESCFPEFLDLVPDADTEFCENRFGRVITVECDRWSYPGSILLFGDAAHSMPPFYGQGLNCSLEGCELLAGMARDHSGAWDDLFMRFERRRRPDVAAVSRLSHANRDELTHGVAAHLYRRRREIEKLFQERFPDRFLPLYAMTTFSTLPYSDAVSRALAQDSVINEFLKETSSTSEIDIARAEKRLSERISCLSASARPLKADWLPRAMADQAYEAFAQPAGSG